MRNQERLQDRLRFLDLVECHVRVGERHSNENGSNIDIREVCNGINGVNDVAANSRDQKHQIEQAQQVVEKHEKRVAFLWWREHVGAILEQKI